MRNRQSMESASFRNLEVLCCDSDARRRKVLKNRVAFLSFRGLGDKTRLFCEAVSRGRLELELVCNFCFVADRS